LTAVIDGPRQRLRDLLARCYNDGDLFNTAILKRLPYWKGQRRISQSLDRFRCTAAYTGNVVGKDYLIGGEIPRWLSTRADSLVIVTGPSQTVLGSITWKEVRRGVSTSPFLKRLVVSQGIRCSPLRLTMRGDWGALGYSTTTVERASGQHNRNLLVIVEEASGVEDEIWDAIESLNYTRLLAIGNPLRAEGGFVRMIKQAHEDKLNGIPDEYATNAIHIPSTASPHAHLQKSPVGLADKTFLEACYRKYGRDSFWVRCHIDAIVPSESSGRLIPVSWIDRCAATSPPVRSPFSPINETRRQGCDISEGVGRDDYCIVVRDDLGILEMDAGNSLGLPEIATRFAALLRKWNVPASRSSYDRIGVGRDFRHHLAANGIREAIGYAGAGRARNHREFSNLRSEAAWKLRTRLNPDWSTDTSYEKAPKQLPFHIAPTAQWPQLRQELEVVTYELVGNQVQMMSKEDHCIELGRSPDRFDALIQTFAF
jgi:hypothetical protein